MNDCKIPIFRPNAEHKKDQYNEVKVIKLYGDADCFNVVSHNIKTAMIDSLSWEELSNDKTKALDSISNSIACILSGDFDEKALWMAISKNADVISWTLK